MKKKLGIIIGLLVVIGVVVSGWILAARKTTIVEPKDDVKSSTKFERMKNEGKAYADNYQMKVSVDTKNKVLSGTVLASVKNATAVNLKNICIRNWAAAILKGKKNKTEITSAKIGNRLLKIQGKDDKSLLYLSDRNEVLLPALRRVNVEFSFRTEIPKQKNRFGYAAFDGNEMYQLSFCFPSISLYQGDHWNENPYVGDSDETYVNEVADYDVTFIHPSDYTVVATGAECLVSNGTRITGKDLREFAIVVSDKVCKFSDKEGKIKISVWGPDYVKNRKYYQYSLQLAKEAIRIFSEKIGPCPFSEVKVVHCFFGGAMEYPGLCMIGMPDVKNFRKLNKDSYGDLESHVPHEIAHQWFYAAIGNDSYREPWLDEGFSEFCEDILFPYYADVKLQKKMQSNKFMSGKEIDQWLQKTVIPQSMRTKPINRKVIDYQDSPDEYSTCVYEGGKLFIYELWKVMGDKTFFKMLQNYYQKYQFQIVTTNDFLAMVRKYQDGEKVERIIRKYVDDDFPEVG